jgi:hypothetical protein
VRAVRGLWRWRRNPLRRTTDLIEAWVALAALLMLLFAAPAVGWVTGSLTHTAMMRTVREQQAERHVVPATVLRVLPHRPFDTDPESASSGELRRRVRARWTGLDGRVHTGTVAGRLDAKPRDRFPLWTDERGHPAARPLDAATADAHTVLAGLGAAIGTGCLIESARWLVVWRLMRRRYGRWDTAWEKAGQDWGRADAGS